MLRWPASSARSVARLFRALQPKDVFVEDVNDEQFYLELFKAAGLGNSVKRVVGLGGREKVISQAAKHDPKRPAIFIVDGDLAWLLGDSPPTPRNIYRLSCYCVENLLIQDRAITSIFCEEAQCSEDNARQILGLTSWRTLCKSLVRVFARFSVLHAIDPSIPTIGRGIGVVILNMGKGVIRLSPEKVETLINALDNEIQSICGTSMTTAVETVEKKLLSLPDPLFAISGKDFVLPLLRFHFLELSKSNISLSGLRFRLARNATSSDLAEIRAAYAKI